MKIKHALPLLLVLICCISSEVARADSFIMNLPLNDATAYDPEPIFIEQEGSAFGGTTGFISQTDGRIYHNATIAASALSHNNLRIKRLKFVPRVFCRKLPIYASLFTIAR